MDISITRLIDMFVNRAEREGIVSHGTTNRADPTAWKRVAVWIAFECDPLDRTGHEDGPPLSAAYEVKLLDCWGSRLDVRDLSGVCVMTAMFDTWGSGGIINGDRRLADFLVEALADGVWSKHKPEVETDDCDYELEAFA